MAKEEFTVLFGVQDSAGAPAIWAEKKLKVLNAAGETKEKNLSPPETSGYKAGGSVVKSCEPQECKIVTITAESAEEACLAVYKYYGQGGQFAAENKLLENVTPNATTASATGPNTMTGLNTGKWAAGVLTEVAVK